MGSLSRNSFCVYFFILFVINFAKLKIINSVESLFENSEKEGFLKIGETKDIIQVKEIIEELNELLEKSAIEGSLAHLIRNANHKKMGNTTNWFSAFTYAEKIIRAGFEFEEHKVLTEDGYINTIWRIPGKQGEAQTQKKQPILLQHGLLDDSWTFFAFEPKYCLPFILAELGYDIWLSNTRGNIFSWENKDPKKNSKLFNSEYWNFSLDEIAKFDFPANVDLVRNKTGFEKILYIGHSQGTMQYFMNYMHDPSFIKQRISRFISVGTVPTIYNQYSPLVKFLSKINIFKLLDDLHIRNILELNPFTDEIVQLFCSNARLICGGIIEAIVQTKVTNRTDFNKVLDLFYYEPGGTSVKNILHWVQIYHNQDLAFYDYGVKKNLKIYGQPKPPSYNMSNFHGYQIPSLITKSDSDPFSSKKDVDLWLNYAKYEEKKDIIKIINLENYNHLDYLWSEDAYEDIYKRIVEFIS